MCNDRVPLLNEQLLVEMLAGGYVRRQTHPTLPLEILNYSEKAAYEGVWNDVTLRCRGLIRSTADGSVVARPFPKFFNLGEPHAPDLDLEAPAVVTDKLDGSLGILYPTPDGYAVATRGSFTSDQALHATEVYRGRYGSFKPDEGYTYLYEILYPANRIVVDYAGRDDLVLLAVVHNETGEILTGFDYAPHWLGPHVERFACFTLAAALELSPRSNAEGIVVRYLGRAGAMVKIKQDDYVALHRILTGTNARHVWEVAAVQACHDLIREPKHWGSFLGIDPARAAEVLALGDDWLKDVPDEFYGWVQTVIETAQDAVIEVSGRAENLAYLATPIIDRRAVYENLSGDPLVKEIMRLADALTANDEPRRKDAMAAILLRAWREATPEPTAPFARSEAIA